MPPPGTIRVGTASPATRPSPAATLALVGELAARAAARAVDVLLLPEALLGGYPRGAAFGCVVGHRSARGRDDFARYFDAAVDLGDAAGGGAGAGARWLRGGAGAGDGTREELERVARETRVFLVVGCVERAGGSLYCAVVYVCPREGVVGKRRKVMPTGAERLVWAQGCPSTLRAVSTTIRGTRVNLAAAICWENYMPLLRQSLYAQNVNLYLAPTADDRDAWQSLVRTIAVEGRCFVVSSNMCDRRVAPSHALPSSPSRRKSVVRDADGNEIVLHCEDDETDGPAEGPAAAAAAAASPPVHDGADASPSPASLASRGGSCIVSPFGDVMAGPQWDDDEGIIWADVDMRDCIRGRLDLDTAGSYSRGDSFKLTVQGLDMDPLPY